MTGNLIYKHRTSDKKIALTFDDGPDPKHTPFLLDLLKAAGAKATFFAVGRQLESYPSLARRIVEEGHDLGNHTYSHPDLSKLDAGPMHEELLKTELIIQNITETKPRLFRPPYLSCNRQVVKAAQKFGYLTIMASIDTHDYKRPGVKPIVGTVMSKLNKGAIVLMHDSGGDRRQTIEAMEKLLGKLNKKQYECVSVTELFHSPNSHEDA
ncbi:polysaccharide deacetylase family protein [Paenibacillus allorhizosphaerae]|uniref:Peptidoglycan-N-acetylglucosamine deacetylase n=1 Tax=Paenibacillus allorhizosphaerae TaxID=2849866 RepID=A0ABM8VQ40_9BACL|nr:polysaccharide deacetylase family protein [Paenibacillus allorhizosphaerae]CAG7653640.1 Peptidoglycan-N-acetylglucosamine deacetylase [Paenibacillus allorhizosphaerae]